MKVLFAKLLPILVQYLPDPLLNRGNVAFRQVAFLELVIQSQPEYLEAFCNQATVTVAELLRKGQKGGVMAGDIYEIIIQLHTLREAFRQVRGAPCWP